ncbi:nuclear pore complex protein Nup205 [Pseudohyphozyma bogoriensis]|nr:nuclear pore complex protein Nup205 [Pseudohyphozyma bogoriensis]
MDRFARLHAFLEDVLANPPEDVSRLQLKLERARPLFLSLLDTPAKNAQERATLEKGSFTYVATGTSYPAGQALAKEILFLSDTLSASEDLCASLVSFGINAQPHSGRGRAESGLVVYLTERASLLRCLQAIWRGALSADERLVASGVQQILERETEELTGGKGREVIVEPATKRKGTWVEKIVTELDRSKALTDSLRATIHRQGPSTALIPSTHGASFSDETNEMRIQQHTEERNSLGQLLFLIGAARQMSKSELLLLTRQLSQLAPTDPASIYFLTAILAALDSSDAGAAQQLYPLFSDAKFVADVNKLLETPWTIPQLRATVQLQWSVFLESAAQVVPNFETDGGELVDNLTWEAIDSGVFAFLGRSVLSYKRDGELDEVWGGVGSGMPELGGGIAVEPWFQNYVSDQVELLIVEVITSRVSVLRKLRNREEDLLSTSHRGGGRRHSRGGLDDRPKEPRQELESLFLLLATIYRNSPDSALKFWEEDTGAASTSAYNPVTSRLAAFLRWGSECRPPGMMRAYYEMVASLASGPRSATYAFEFLSSPGAVEGASNFQAPPSSTFSWAALFGALEYYHTNLPDRPVEAGPNAEGVLGEMPPEEVPLLRSFVRLLRQVVAFSDVARATLYDNQRHRPIATLFALLGRPIPIELKASLLGAISAFARPGGAFGVEVARRTWTALEQSQILPTLAVSEGRDARGGAGLGLASSGAPFRAPGPLTITGGIFTELEEVEAPNKVYPESTAFVQLLNTLIHTPSSLEPVRRGVELDTQTIPDNLGAPHRAPGIDPYLRFVLDDVLLKTGSREFADPTERWKVTEVCLAFVEKCLVSYDLGPFLAAAAVGAQQTASGPTSPLAQLVLHPGFDVLTRILSSSELLESILTIVTAGYGAISQNLAGTPLFTKCVLRCLRIIHRVLELQAPFLEVVLPSLGASTVQIPHDKLGRLKSVGTVDQSLLYNSEAVVQIALCVGCEEEDEIALISVQILSIIAQSPLFDVVQQFPEQSRNKLNRLVGILDASPETLRIMEGFVHRLEEDVPESDLEEGEWDGPEGDGGSIRQAIRSAILDLLLQGTQPDRAAPNVAHLLLGFSIHGRPSEMEIDDPDSPDTQRTSLHVILELLHQNVSHDAAEAQLSLLSRHPTLAAKCYRLVRQLCLHPHTSAAVSRYLRNREKFFHRQTVALPFDVPSAKEGALGGIQYADGRQLVTSSAAVCSILQSEAWLLESTALELSVLATGNDTQRELELVTALFGVSTSSDDGTAFFEQGTVDQPLPRILEVFHAFDFAWHDSITPNDQRLSVFAELRFDSCLRLDSTGCEIYDFGALLALIGAAKRELQNRGSLNTSAQQEEAKKETRSIVETLVVENHRRQIQFARFHGLRAWRSLLDITLTKAFHLLPAEGRHSILLDLMGAILPPIAAQETDRAISELLSGAAVLLMTKLRDEGIRTVGGDGIDAALAVSPEHLHSVLRAILHAILQPGVSAVVRGNLYAALLNYVQYSAKMSSASPALAKTLPDDSMASYNDDVMSLDGVSTVGSRRSSRRNALESGNLAIFQSALDRLVPVICRDAAVGHEVWRTVAFTALDALLTIAEEGRAVSKVLTILTKQGYLQSFVTSLKDAEADLLETLEADPESLNALYIYEAQMSFLIRVASTRDGAEKLLSAGLFTKLAQCEYLGARPQVDSTPMDFDGFLPPASERHHQLLLPALQLIVGTIVSFGQEMLIATREAIAFISGQRENLVIALRNASTTQTVSSLREAHLVVTLLSAVLPAISEEDLTTLSSYGGLHSAVLGLSAKVCESQSWKSKVAPSNETEREEDQVLVPALRNPGTLFSEKVETLVESLETAILTYHSVATRKRAGTNAFRPVWLPSLSLENASAPTLGSASAFLKDVVVDLSKRLEDVVGVSTRLEHFDATPVEELEEALSLPDEDGVDARERRTRVLVELQALQTKYRLQVTSSLHLIEVGLLLYWRHVAFFVDPERQDRDGASSRPDFGLGLAESLKSRSQHGVSSIDIPALRAGIAESFKPVATRLSTLSLTQQTMVPQPLPYTPPVDPRMVVDPDLKTDPEAPVEPLPFTRNASSRPWKQPRVAKARTDKTNSSWDKRQEQRKKDDAVKKIEREMKDEKQAEIDRKRTINTERKTREAEKRRLEEMAARMSAKKLQRMKKRLGRTKKVNA